VAALPPAPERRRARPGSLERPINGRLYRGTWLLVGLPLLVLAFSVARPAALSPPTGLPPAFDTNAAAALAGQLSTQYPIRGVGSPGAVGAARWYSDQLSPYGFVVRRQPFTTVVAGRGRIHGVNLLATTPGVSQKTIILMAHRDDAGTGPGANDNASGTAALLELARAYAPSAAGKRVRLPYSILFLSTDAGVDGGVGAAWFAAHAPEARDAIAVLDLDAVAGARRPRVVFSGDTPRSATPGLLETVRAQIAGQTGLDPTRPSGLRQLIDLGFPYSRFEQGPFVSRGIPAVTLTTAPDRPTDGLGDDTAGIHRGRLGQIGRAAQNTLDALEQGVALTPGPGSYIFLGSRIVRGWAIELVLIACLLPFLTAAVDLFARCRRRRIRVAPALRAYRSRLAFWAWCGVIFALFTLLGAWPTGAARPPGLRDVHWPQAALLGAAVLVFLGWIVARDRLIPRRPIAPEEVLAGHTAALLALGVVALLVVATNPFALIFVLPSLHLWLWMPQLREASRWVRALVLLAGFAGAGLLLWSFAGRYGLGWDAPWYIAWLYALGYAPAQGLVIGLGWLAGAAQLVAIAVGRYAPYPSAAERPPRGPLRELVRRAVLARRRRRASERARQALHG
jgi:alkaline phosphatase isozyme conversion protein